MAASLNANQKYRRLVTVLFLMVILAAAQPFLWRFVHTQALGLQQTRSLELQIANVQTRNEDIKKVLKTESDFLDQLDVVAPPVAAKTQVVERVEQLGDQLGLLMDITVIQELPLTGATGKDGTIVPVSVSVQTTGTAPQLLGLMDRLEHTQELSMIPKWTLVPAVSTAVPPGTTPTANDKYTLTMDIFFFLRRANGG